MSRDLNVWQASSEPFNTFVRNSDAGKRLILPTDKIAKAVLALVLNLRYSDRISHQKYSSCDGTTLPAMSGCNLVNAACTYIDHGGDKTEAIEKFIDKNLRTEKQLKELLDYLNEKL